MALAPAAPGAAVWGAGGGGASAASSSISAASCRLVGCRGRHMHLLCWALAGLRQGVRSVKRVPTSLARVRCISAASSGQSLQACSSASDASGASDSAISTEAFTQSAAATPLRCPAADARHACRRWCLLPPSMPALHPGQGVSCRSRGKAVGVAVVVLAARAGGTVERGSVGEAFRERCARVGDCSPTQQEATRLRHTYSLSFCARRERYPVCVQGRVGGGEGRRRQRLAA